MFHFSKSIILFIACIAVMTPSIVSAADFRVDNEVYVGDQKEPSSRSATLFHKGVIYDFLDGTPEVIIYRPAQGQFDIINMKSGLRTAIPVQSVESFVTQLQKQALQSKHPQIRWMADPKFKEQWFGDQSRLVLTADTCAYSLGLIAPKDPTITAQYAGFADAVARLNALVSQGARPPFPRLAVNRAIARYRAMPSEISLMIRPDPNTDPLHLKSVHKLVSLTESDLKRIQNAEHFAKSFKTVQFTEYQKALR